jgi:hypothetical protein
MWDIPVSTLREHVSAAREGGTVGERGRPVFLGGLGERALVRCAKLRARLRFSVNKRLMLKWASSLAVKMRQPFKTASGLPSKSWFRRFLRDHPDIPFRKPTKIQPGKARLTMEDLQETYTLFDELCKELNFGPADIYNYDEVGHDKTVGGRGKRFGDAAMRRCEYFQPFSEHVTVGVTIRADGVRLPPLYIMKGVPGASHNKDIQARLLQGTEQRGAAITWTGQ